MGLTSPQFGQVSDRGSALSIKRQTGHSATACMGFGEIGVSDFSVPAYPYVGPFAILKANTPWLGTWTIGRCGSGNGIPRPANNSLRTCPTWTGSFMDSPPLTGVSPSPCYCLRPTTVEGQKQQPTRNHSNIPILLIHVKSIVKRTT